MNRRIDGHRLIDRKALPKITGDTLMLNWADFAAHSLASTKRLRHGLYRKH